MLTRPRRHPRPDPRPARRSLAIPGLLLSLLLLGIGPCQLPLRIGIPSGNTLPVKIQLPDETDPASVTVDFDGNDVTGAFAPGGPGLIGALPLPGPGPHTLSMTRPVMVLPGLHFPLTLRHTFSSPTAAPEVIGIAPASPLPRSGWLRLQLASEPDASALTSWGFGLECNGHRIGRAAHALSDGVVILNPHGVLPPGGNCRIAWLASDGSVGETGFAVAANAAGAGASVLYDRDDPLSIAPFPDDYFTRVNTDLPAQIEVDLPLPPFPNEFQRQVWTGLTSQTIGVDGWSRQPPIVIALSHRLDESAVPADEIEAQDPFAPIVLVDVDPDSPDFGARIPYRMLVRRDLAPDFTFDDVALLFPTIDLRERGHYAVVVTRRAYARNEPGRPFGPSQAFGRVLGLPLPGESAAIARARGQVEPVVRILGELPVAPIPREDLALVVPVSIRTAPSVDDLIHIKELALAAPPPELLIPDASEGACSGPADDFCIELRAGRALVVRGKVLLPNYRGADFLFVRDPDTGIPVPQTLVEVPFVLSLPLQALDGPVFPIMYQHGNPGSPRELEANFTNGHLDDAGFALVGMQDTLNRELGEDQDIQVQAIFFFIAQIAVLPDYWNQTGADMIHFLRAIQGMGDLDLLRAGPDGSPEIGPDGNPEIDPSVLLYKGISEGGNNAQRFLPFAPELLAAAPTVGGARLGETLIHQSAAELLAQLRVFLPDLRPVETWIGLSLFQAGYDRQDGHSYLRHLYADPLLPFAGSSDVTPPSTIWTEGIGDTLVPNNASRAAARELGIPQVSPALVPVPGLEQVAAPLSENLGTGLTAGYVQYDPATTPSCLSTGQSEGHFCAQTAIEAFEQRLHFYQTAIEGAPEIIDTLSE